MQLVAGEERELARQRSQVGPAIFRIVQEALTNAYKHANATEISVHLCYLPGYVEVEICDNGRGMQVVNQSNSLSINGERQRIYSGHGLRGMLERAEELGGSVEITSQPNAGVKVRASIPIM
jgi:signal transduction histidine kinase